MVDTHTSIKLAQWLLSVSHIKNARPVFVKIGYRTYSAARYTKRRRDFLYVVGQLPPLHNRRRLCYRTDDSENAWHVLAWQTSTSAEWQEVHPFGNHFVLVQRSPLENWAEDQCQGKPFRRIPMTIEEIGPTDVDVGRHDKKQK